MKVIIPEGLETEELASYNINSPFCVKNKRCLAPNAVPVENLHNATDESAKETQ